MSKGYVIKSGGDGIVMGVFWGMMLFSIVKGIFLWIVYKFFPAIIAGAAGY